MQNVNLHAIYPLSFLQKALLFHSLQAQDDQGLVFVQCRLKGELQPRLLQQAWGLLLQRHEALRSSIHWEKIAKPIQLIHKKVDLPWHEIDW
ncbi:MAG: condensation domain-containing protein, partial [Bacteroidota bacterium]